MKINQVLIFLIGKCVCKTGYVGNGCETLETFNCTKNCTGRGTCNTLTGHSFILHNEIMNYFIIGGCTCNTGFTGDYCQNAITITCPLNCSGNGGCLSNGDFLL